MKRASIVILLFCIAQSAFAQKVVSVMGAIVGNTQNTPKVQYTVTFDSFGVAPSGATSNQIALDSTRFALVTGSGEKVYASRVTLNTAVSGVLNITFIVTSANFQVFDGLVSADAGAYLVNEQNISLVNGTYGVGQLETDTKGKLTAISESDWTQYILNENSANYLFPQEFKVGTDLGGQDSNQTTYYLQVQQSRPWVATSSNLSFYWGLQGRWSTMANDPFNFAQFYPVVLQYDLLFSRLSVLGGVEIGSAGFSKSGRGTGMLNYEFRFPWNLVDLTFGAPRVAVHPLIDISGQFSKAWGDQQLPDSLDHGIDVNGTIRYNIPVLDKYLLQTNAGVNWSYQTKELHYLYDLSLGYVANGSIRIMLEYKQGYMNVTQVFDKQLLLGFAFDALNRLVPN